MFRVYYTDPVSGVAHAYDTEQLSEALRFAEGFRNLGMTFVTMVSENPNNVGKTGVAAVKDGVLPDGSKYDWTKKDRVGAAFKSPPPVSTDNLVVDLDDPR
jgi:hypothetical protein